MPWLMDKGFTLKTPLTNDYIEDNAAQFEEMNLLHLNEAFDSPEALVKREVEASLSSLNRYPDIKRGPLSRAVAKNTGVEPDCQAWGAGASDLLYRAFNAVSNAGKNAVAPTHILGIRAYLWLNKSGYTPSSNSCGLPNLCKRCVSCDG